MSNETRPVSILLILSNTLIATFRESVCFPRKLGSFLLSCFRCGMAVL
jgi:hypothetical protein